METTSQFVQIAPPSDIVVSIFFEVRIGNIRGAMSICIPYLLLKPITSKLSAQKWFVSTNRKQSTSNRKLLSYQVSQTQVDCSVQLGSTKVSVKDFLTLRPGDMIRLNQDQNDELLFCVSDMPKYLGKPVLSGKRLLFTVHQPIAQD